MLNTQHIHPDVVGEDYHPHNDFDFDTEVHLWLPYSPQSGYADEDMLWYPAFVSLLDFEGKTWTEWHPFGGTVAGEHMASVEIKDYVVLSAYTLEDVTPYLTRESRNEVLAELEEVAYEKL